MPAHKIELHSVRARLFLRNRDGWVIVTFVYTLIVNLKSQKSYTDLKSSSKGAPNHNFMSILKSCPPTLIQYHELRLSGIVIKI